VTSTPHGPRRLAKVNALEATGWMASRQSCVTGTGKAKHQMRERSTSAEALPLVIKK
jgi:hypothetical protein